MAVTLVGVWVLASPLGLLPHWRLLLAYTLGAVLVANISWLDDLRPLPNWVRFAAHSLAAVCILATAGGFRQITIPLVGTVEFGWVGVVLTFIWIVALTNAYNFMDGIDGLAGGQAVTAGLGWAILGWLGNQPLAGTLALLAGSGSLGFLGHNWPPAKIFMGDVGSAFLGYTFAAIPVLFYSLSGPGTSGAVPVLGVLLVWPFVFDAVFTFLRRLKARENVFTAHKSHLYQRLVTAGADPQSVTGLYLALGLMGLIFGKVWDVDAPRGSGAGILPALFLGLLLWGSAREYERGAFSTPFLQAHLLRYRRAAIILSQMALLALTYYTSFLLRLDFKLEPPYLDAFLVTLPLVLLTKLLVFSYFRLFSGWWRYVGMSDLLDIIKAAALSAPVIYGGTYWLRGLAGLPRSVFIIDPILTIFAVGGMRFAVRAYYESARLHLIDPNTLIVGAGSAGSSIARELKSNRTLAYTPIGFVDDDRTKIGVKVQGLKVLGTTDELHELIVEHDISHILIAIPSASGKQIQRIIDKCRQCKVEFKTLPAIGDLITNSVSLGSMRAVRVEDLLVREPVRLELTRIRQKLEGKTVLITGAGGSIGSEMTRQISGFNPGKLVLLDRSETDLFNIDLELSESFPGLNKVAVIGDILDVGRLREVFTNHRPHSVFHAAAYKHVPVMEGNCFEAVNNNIFGTYNVALIAKQCEAEDFVMISSDKAVNPTNVMGVTKRVAELITLGLQRQSTRFVSVRFGNVLGSRGSVLTLFEKQIAARKPISITDREAKRYFMTVHEAVQLVLQASTMGQGAEIFVLDMGEPVKIVDLATTLLRLSGLEPGRDLPIVFTGLRPGEKLFEELKLDGEGIKQTSHPKIRVLDGGPVSFDSIRKWLDELASLLESKNVNGLVTKLQEIVPEYTPSKEILALCAVDRYDRVGSYNRARASLAASE